MPLSGLPIVSIPWVRSVLRRITAEDPTIRVYHTAKYILNEVFGRDWVACHIERRSRGSGGFFRSDFPNGPGAALHLLRGVSLAEKILNLQRVRGVPGRAGHIENTGQIEAALAALAGGELVFTPRRGFEW